MRPASSRPTRISTESTEIKQTRFFKEPHQIKYRLYNGIVDYDFGFASLTSSTSYGTSDETFTLDAVPILANGLTLLFGPFNPMPGVALFPGFCGRGAHRRTDRAIRGSANGFSQVHSGSPARIAIE